MQAEPGGAGALALMANALFLSGRSRQAVVAIVAVFPAPQFSADLEVKRSQQPVVRVTG